MSIYPVFIKLYPLANKLLPLGSRRRDVVRRFYWWTREVFSARSNSMESVSRISRVPKTLSHRKFRVLYVIGSKNLPSNRYRVYSSHEYLRLFGIESSIMQHQEIVSSNMVDLAQACDIVVFFRVASGERLLKFVDICCRLSTITIFDCDDYIFDREIATPEIIDGMRFLSNDELKAYFDGIDRYKRMLMACDYFTTTTEFLAQRAKLLGKPSFVLRNGLNKELLEISIRLKDRSEQTDDIVRILYASGTLTHQKDFAVAVSALCRILSEYSNVKLMLIGLFKLEEFPNLDPFSNRIEKYDVVPWRVLPSLMAKADINIAPLEMNPYTNSKSELKYFEAAVLKIPTVATPTPAFKRAIKHGENGFLAENENKWYARLKDLVFDIKLRQEVGEAAFSHAISHYSPVVLGQKIKSTYSAIICDYLKCRDVSRERLSISIVIPPPFSGSGGHNKIFEIADFLQNRGHSVNIFSSSPSHEFGSDQEFVDFIRAKFGFSFTSYIGANKVRPCDILIATHHSTAYSVAEMINSYVAGFYFVQDYEPYFVPMGEEYIRAENSYHLGLYHICYGNWLPGLIRKQAKSPVTWIPFYLNKEKYHPIETIQRSKTRLIYFARPDMPRRCFHLGADALNLFHKILPDVEIVLFGTNYLPKEKMLFPYQDMGVLDQSSLVKLYNSSTAALCFTTTNPSMAPFEIMACGCPVVDLDFNDNDITYGELANVFLVPPDAKGIAKELAFLFQDEGIRQQIALNGSKYMREKMASPEEALKRFEEILWHGIRFAEQNDLSYLFGTNG